MNPHLLKLACDLYQTTPDELVPLSGGHYNAVYRYPLPQILQVTNTSTDSKYGVLRIGLEDCPADQTLGTMEWVRFLSEQGTPVVVPVSSTQGRLLERLEQGGKAYTITSFEEAEGTLAERILPEQWTDELFRSIGRAVGKMHDASKRYLPSSPERTRPQWFNSSEIADAINKLADYADPVRKRLVKLIKELRQLPAAPEDYGLIHDDLHFANFLIQPDNGIRIIDFDDCAYGWFAMDVAMALFDVLVLYHTTSEAESQAFANRFMACYLSGYRQQNELSTFFKEKIPLFLKLKELCVYAPLIGHPDINLPDSWVGRFMHGRAERIAHDVPYVGINFDIL